MRAVDLIRKKRDGGELTPDEIGFFVRGVAADQIPAYQASAWLMAVVLCGMSAGETEAMTAAMTASGSRLDLSAVARPKVDKHSTGGVGDKTSPVLAPLAAACGVAVPMVSGRGLGHTGGTLDKLESIPGFRTVLTPDEIRGVLDRTGCCLVGQTETLAPADRVLYALRDATATVESVPLIAASIMSKKLAADLDGLVLDVTVGRGAFMKTTTQARELADCLVAIGNAAGVRMRAVLTAMDAPRGCAVGNALEMAECFATLRETIEAQGGDPRVVDAPARMPSVPTVDRVPAPRSGYLAALDAELVGRAAVVLGAGRDQVDHAVDHAVGVVVRVGMGEPVTAGDPVVELHHRETRGLDAARELVTRAVRIDDVAPPPPPRILETVA